MLKRRFTIVYWLVIFLIITIYSWQNGLERKKEYMEVEGLVIDQVQVRKGRRFLRSYDAMMPQIAYPVADSSYIFVDHQSRLPNGDKPTILYRRKKVSEALVYNWRFWIDTGFAVPVIIISGFVFALIIMSLPEGRNAAKLN